MRSPQDQMPGLPLEPICDGKLWVSILKNHYFTQGGPEEPMVPYSSLGTQLSLQLLLQIQSYMEHGYTAICDD